MPDAAVFGPEPERPDVSEQLAAYASLAADALMSSLRPLFDFVDQVARALMPVVEVRRAQMSAGRREYHRRSLARRRRRR